VFSDGLDNATGLAIRDDAFYVSAFGRSSTQGEVVMISAVPEPETWALLIVGLGAIGCLRPTRRSKGGNAEGARSGAPSGASSSSASATGSGPAWRR
jgi:PEP-CTERM motif